MELYSLNIQTSTTLCSVALGKNDCCIDVLEEDDGQYHSEKLHLFIQDLLKKNNFDIQQLNVIAVSYGPGSYTGLRIGAATAKAMAYALNIPLVVISSLKIQVLCFLDQVKLSTEKYIASTMKARGHKIYMGIYSHCGEEIQKPEPFIWNKNTVVQLSETYHQNLIFIGNACNSQELDCSDTEWYQNINLSAKQMIKETYQMFLDKKFADLIYFEPLYI